MLHELTTDTTYMPLKRLSIFYGGFSLINEILTTEGIDTYSFPMDRNTILENFKRVDNKKAITELVATILGLSSFTYDEETEMFSDGVKMSIGNLSGGTVQFLGVATIISNYKLFGKNGVSILHPEAGLHPKSQSALGSYLVQAYAANFTDDTPQIFIDTYSDHILNGMRVGLIKSKNLDNVIVNYVKAGNVMSLFVKNDGSFSSWPEGFMDQNHKDLAELFNYRK